MSLSPRQRDDLHRLLAAELEDAWRTAADDGAAVRITAEPVGEKTVRRPLG
jgi:hypothetical protein